VNVTQRLRIASTVALLTLPAMSSCGSNFNAPTDQVYQPGVGVNDRSGSIDVLHALIVSGEDGTGTLIAALVNNEVESDDALVGVAGFADDASIKVTARGDQVEIPAGELYQLAEEGNISVRADQVKPGRFIELTFSFELGESVTLEVPVVARSGDYANVPVPAAS